MKKFALAIILVVLAVILCSCSSQTDASNSTNDSKSDNIIRIGKEIFIAVGEAEIYDNFGEGYPRKQEIVVNYKNKVMYVYSISHYWGSYMCPLLNPDGTAQTYEGELPEL